MNKTIIIAMAVLLAVIGIANVISITRAVDVNIVMDGLKTLLQSREVSAPEPILESDLGGLADAPRDVFGTKVGTTTTVVNFSLEDGSSGSQSATTTYVEWVGREVDEAIFTIGVGEASSTANLKFNFIASNDDHCWTATTTYSSNYNWPAISEIYWTDASHHVKNAAAQTAFAATSTLFVWSTPKSGYARKLILTNLNYQCLGMAVSGASTTAWCQVATKAR